MAELKPLDGTVSNVRTCENCAHSFDWHRKAGSIAKKHKVVCFRERDTGLDLGRLHTRTNQLACQRHEFEGYEKMLKRLDWDSLLLQVLTPNHLKTDLQFEATFTVLRLVALFRRKGFGFCIPEEFPDIQYLSLDEE